MPSAVHQNLLSCNTLVSHQHLLLLLLSNKYKMSATVQLCLFRLSFIPYMSQHLMLGFSSLQSLRHTHRNPQAALRMLFPC